jgi:imidazolonepropionase
MKADLIIKTDGQLVTCSANDRVKKGAAMSDVGIIGQGAVAVSDGKIIAVGDQPEIFEEFESDVVVDAGNAVISPGFVDPHTHIVFAGDRLDEFEMKIAGRDYLDILAAGGGILSTVRNTREAAVEELIQTATGRLDKMLAFGTTTAEIKTGYGLDLETELKMLQVIEELDRSHPVDVVPTLLAAHTIPLEFKYNFDGYVDLICREILPAAWNWYQKSHFVDKRTPFFVDVFCEKNAFDLDQTITIIEKAAEYGFAIKAHVDEFTNLGGSRALIEMGATSIDHLDAISEDEIKILSGSHTVGVVTPTVNFNFGSVHFANARKMIDLDCSLAISTDYNPGSAPCPSLPAAMAIACRYQKLTPAEALTAVTINAAGAIGMEQSIGSLEVGKQADLLIFDVTDHREIAYEFGTMPVRSVYKKGVLVYDRQH